MGIGGLSPWAASKGETPRILSFFKKGDQKTFRKRGI